MEGFKASRERYASEGSKLTHRTHSCLNSAFSFCLLIVCSLRYTSFVQLVLIIFSANSSQIHPSFPIHQTLSLFFFNSSRPIFAAPNSLGYIVLHWSMATVSQKTFIFSAGNNCQSLDECMPNSPLHSCLWGSLACVLNMLSKSLCTAALHIWKITFACSHLPTSTLLWTSRPVLEETLFWRVSHSRVC